MITAYLENDTDESFARRVRGRVEKTVLSEVCKFMEEVYFEDNGFLAVQLDMDRVKLLQLGVDIDSIVHK